MRLTCMARVELHHNIDILKFDKVFMIVHNQDYINRFYFSLPGRWHCIVSASRVSIYPFRSTLWHKWVSIAIWFLSFKFVRLSSRFIIFCFENILMCSLNFWIIKKILRWVECDSEVCVDVCATFFIIFQDILQLVGHRNHQRSGQKHLDAH